jgi:hypothetical protein
MRADRAFFVSRKDRTMTALMTDRTTEILAAVDAMLEAHDAWEADEEVTLPTRELEQAINNAVETCDVGDVPAQCRELVLKMGRLGLEWEKYQNGMSRTPDHRPIGAFWGAYRAVVEARAVATPQAVKQPEPVHLLLSQKVPERQIAFFIWGWRNPATGKFEGPFVTAAQQPDITKIHEEAKEPGKHTKDWIHPEQLLRQRERGIELSRRLTSIERKESADTPTEEKATVLEMLQEGQYPDVIARVKRVTLDDVLKVAEQNNIKVAMRPNLAAERAPHEPGIFGQEPELPSYSTDDDDEEDLDDDDDDDEPTSPVESEPTQSVDDLILELSASGKDQPSIVAECRSRGHSVTFQQIKAVLKAAKAK